MGPRFRGELPLVSGINLEKQGAPATPARALAESGPMQIVCPHCSTSYGISPAALGEAGRTVRCSRCKEVWLARPEDAVEFANVTANGADEAADWNSYEQTDAENDAPHVDSPSIAGDWQGSARDQGYSG